MNPKEICGYLTNLGYSAQLTEDNRELTVSFLVGDLRLSLVHEFPDELLRLPSFDLIDANNVGQLGHVITKYDTGRGSVCVTDADSVSVNIHVPELAYADSLERHIELLRRLIEDQEWNQSELIREFHSHWELLCSRAGTGKNILYVVSDTEHVGSLQVKLPRKDTSFGVGGHRLAVTQEIANNKSFETVLKHARWSSRTLEGKGLLLQCTNLMPAPTSQDELLPWYVEVMRRLDDESRDAVKRIRKHSSKRYWLVFSASVQDGTTWLAILCQSERKGRLPLCEEDAQGWSLTPYSVHSLSRESLVPRGGGSLDLAERSVLLVGCGSVGSELAQRLTSAGLGHVTISDPDYFTEANLYRHTLSLPDIGLNKSVAVAHDLQMKHLWANVAAWKNCLENLRIAEKLQGFDMIIVAIGSPTIERVFHEYILRANIEIPIINCWVEAYGIGGHAILDIPESRGCWYCAYVDPDTLGRGLASNLNFLAPNQDLTMAYGGCGYQFLPYSGIAASYTATMTADLAVRFMTGDISTSSKISWKGSAVEAERLGFEVTHRFRNFKQSLSMLPLYNDECDVCAN